MSTIGGKEIVSERSAGGKIVQNSRHFERRVSRRLDINIDKVLLSPNSKRCGCAEIIGVGKEGSPVSIDFHAKVVIPRSNPCEYVLSVRIGVGAPQRIKRRHAVPKL